MKKIDGQDLERFTRLIHETLDKNPNAQQQYKDKGLSPIRFYWDTFHVTSDTIQRSGRVEDYLFIRRLYDYANDEHITTALKHAINAYRVTS